MLPAIPHSVIAVLLFSFGAAGFLGNILTGLFIDRFMKPLLLLALLVTCSALIALGWFGAKLDFVLILICLVTWGVAIATLFIGLQTWVLRAAGSVAAMPASAIYTAIFNSAAGVGAMLGAWILISAGLSRIMASAGGAVVLAISVILLASQRDGLSMDWM